MSIANELITRGWTQGASKDEDGRVCLTYAAMLNVGVLSGLPALRKAIGMAPGSSIAVWNDEPGRTFGEVLRVAKLADELLGQ